MRNSNSVTVSQVSDVTTVEITTVGPQGPGFDLTLGIRSSFPAVVETGGSFTLPAKLFNDIISRLPNGSITIDDDAGEAIATITSTSGRYQVRGMGGEGATRWSLN